MKSPKSLHAPMVNLLILAIALAGCSSAQRQTPAALPQASGTPTLAPTMAPTNTPPATAAPAPDIGSTFTRAADGMQMMYVPQGEFTMGRDAGLPAERPAHAVTLDAFWIDQIEVTNAMYQKCVTAGACKPPLANSSFQRHTYYGDPQFDAFPVIAVNWESGMAYCTWAGARLPTEAEWEKAARGLDGRLYPWGETASCDVANTNGCQGDTSAAGKYEKGKSPYGLFDMAGNVLEWTADWYDAKYYSGSPSSNPPGPEAGQFKVARGGSWFEFAESATTTARTKHSPGDGLNRVGFRCDLTASTAQQSAAEAASSAIPTSVAGALVATAAPGDAALAAQACERPDIAYGESVWDTAGQGENLGGRWQELRFCGSEGDVVDIQAIVKMVPLSQHDVNRCLLLSYRIDRLEILPEVGQQPLAQAEKLGRQVALIGYKLPQTGTFRIFFAYGGNGMFCAGATISLSKE